MKLRQFGSTMLMTFETAHCGEVERLKLVLNF